LRPFCFVAGHRKSRARISRRRYDFGSAARVALECCHYVALEITQKGHVCIVSVARNLHARLGEKFTLKRQYLAERPTENGADAAAERAEAWS
jgi:hypothetical protein